MRGAQDAMLAIKGVTQRFGGLVALDKISFSVNEGEIRGLIGPNGSGKSTLFKNISGFYKPTGGEIVYRGQNVVGHSTSAIAALGIVRTFQETTLFQEMTVRENVLVGCHLRACSNLFAAIACTDREKQRQSERKALEMIEFMGLAERKEQLASELPLGSQRALALAIALAAEPKLLLMDEPFAGMNPEETRRMMQLTRKVRDSGITIILVEHDMKAVMGLCEFLTVLNFGKLLAEGTPEQIRANEQVIEAYLGGVK
ncbi:MAG: ABC transporter ATP-binding protein [Gammaproteobacteria bacterium]|nr:ABC transporter ATP-binding protein [Gammaproteobacteria bacterium]